MENTQLSRACAAIALGALLAAAPVAGQGPQTQDGRHYFQKAMAAYKAKDYAAYLANMKTAVSLRPGHPAYVFNTAGAHALAGKSDEALAWLEKFAAMGMVADAAKDADLASLAALPRFREVVARIEANKAPVGSSETAFTVPARGLLAEGVAYDPVTKTFFLSSVREHKVLAVDPAGKVKDFSSQSDGLWGVLGMRVDARRRRLWAVTSTFPESPGFDEAAGRRSAIVEYDLASGKLVARHALPAGTGENMLGDLLVASNGDVYATDSVSPNVFVLRAGAKAPEVFMRGEPFVNLQGLALSPDEKTLFLADYSRGVIAVDMASRRATVLPIPDATTALGIDGLYFHEGDLIGIQNGTAPHRVIRMGLARDFSRVERVSVVAANDPVWDEPTLGVVVDGALYYNAVSQWGNVKAGGELARPEAAREAVVMRVKL
jgi:hypothetical protein